MDQVASWVGDVREETGDEIEGVEAPRPMSGVLESRIVRARSAPASLSVLTAIPTRRAKSTSSYSC
jgi:hypothetical protein